MNSVRIYQDNCAILCKRLHVIVLRQNLLCSYFLDGYRAPWHLIPDENLWLVGHNSKISLLMTDMHPEVFPFLHTGMFSNWRGYNSVLRLWNQGATKLKFICFHWHKSNSSFVDSFAAQTQSVTAASGLIWRVLSLSESKPNIAETNSVTVSVTTEACFADICPCQRPLMELEFLTAFLFFIIWISSVPSSLCLIWGTRASCEWVPGSTPLHFHNFIRMAG